MTASYVLGAMTLSLGAQVAKEIVASSNSLVNCGTIALFALFSGLAAILARSQPPNRVMLAGAGSAIVSSALLAIAASWHSLPLYTVAQIFSGVAYSLLLLSGLSLINAAAPVTHRGATLSALFLVAYLAQAVAALSLGRVATSITLATAVDVGAGVVVTLAILALILDAIRKTAHVRKTGNKSR